LVETTDRRGSVVRVARDGEPPTRVAIVPDVRRDDEPAQAFERVSPELAARAQRLRALFDVQAQPPDELSPSSERFIVERRVADAIRAADASLAGLWLDWLLDLCAQAVRARHGRARNRKTHDDPRILRPVSTLVPPTSPRDVLRALAHRCSLALNVTALPDYIRAAEVAWALEHVSFTPKGGGRGSKAKLSPKRLADLLADPRKLARAMRGPNSKR
jgi:hypothetical protein